MFMTMSGTESRPGCPPDAYTPHGYLANPYAVARSWSEGTGGCLRSSRNAVGFGWQLPWALRAEASLDLTVQLEGGGRRYKQRSDFADAGLITTEHSARVFTYQWQALGRVWTAAYTLVEQDTLGLELTWAPAPPTSSAPSALPEASITVALDGWRRDGAATVQGASVDLGAPYGRCTLQSDPSCQQAPTTPVNVGAGAALVGCSLMVTGETGNLSVIARRTATEGQNAPHALGHSVGQEVRMALASARADDAAFWAGATRLSGDWPDAWRRGWIYDTETTRMCVYPAGGIFTDVWPAWMIQWPRAVVAEGTLDMARFGYASPDLAQRALLSLFRDAEAPNVPCVFRHGEPNMVANDGSVCGTSPAWCVPFFNLERLFAQTFDHGWLTAIYPYLAGYVEWWLAERTDAAGWAVYKCTWEAGEDDTPRLDPEQRGDNVVSAFVRPVELQATMALSAGVLARFADVLGQPADAARWRSVEADYRERTAALWDADAGRYRDWDARTGRFQDPASISNYWGIDVCRYSALAFTPVLAGLTDESHLPGLRRELLEYAGPPWTLWPSWSYVVLEAAALLGDRAFAGRVADEIVGRVYAELDARTIASPAHPTPGVAREFWPLDLATWASCEGYGWGANTASLLVRQIVGFIEGPYLTTALTPWPPLPQAGEGVSQDASRRSAPVWRANMLVFALRPALPDHLLTTGSVYLLAGLPYRGARLTVGYRVEGDAEATADSHTAPLTLIVAAEASTSCQVRDANGSVIFSSDVPGIRHKISGRNGAAYTVTLHPI